MAHVATHHSPYLFTCVMRAPFPSLPSVQPVTVDLVNAADSRKVRQAAAPVHPDGEGAPHDILFRHEPPEPAVLRVVAVVAHRKIAAFRHDDVPRALNLGFKLAITETGCRVNVQVVLNAAQRFVPQLVVGIIRCLCGYQRFGHFLTVDGQRAVLVVDTITRYADHTLDEVLGWIDRIAEDDHIAALRHAHRQNLGVQHRQAKPIGKLVDGNEVADLQRWQHRAGRNLERFDHERANRYNDKQHRKQRARKIDIPRLRCRRVFTARLTAAAQYETIQSPDDGREQQDQHQYQSQIHCMRSSIRDRRHSPATSVTRWS
ncbi:Mg/Co/Ni transporter MgtE [Zymobacter palmae]|uniref:Mg/Co/Ni transporter MgtE n=1 Tax=Zymobacter palmae TaxID=33074 RepID=A0A348HG95_9GAMM|nr:Mg/Co/Ni transporter MgtE [Zymobacter palmae]